MWLNVGGTSLPMAAALAGRLERKFSLWGRIALLRRIALLGLTAGVGAGMGCGGTPLRPQLDGGAGGGPGGRDGAPALDGSPDGAADLALDRADVGAGLDGGGADLVAAMDGVADRTSGGATDASAADGACGPLTALTNCGACGNDCTRLPNVRSGAPVSCMLGQCSFSPTSCAAGFGNCNNSAADGCEDDLTSVDNCGYCRVKCEGPSPACVFGAVGQRQCQVTCAPPLSTMCGRTCVDVNNDAANCGSCGNDCDQLPSKVRPVPCRAGKCQPVCVDGWANCDSDPDCETPLDSVRACGACGVAPACALANVVAACIPGAASCADPHCAAGYANCDKASADCEAALGSTGASCAPRYLGTTTSPVYLESDILIAVAGDGATFVAGIFRGTTDLDPGPGVDMRTSTGQLGAMESDVFVTKLNPDGGYAWTRTFGGTRYEDITDLAVTAEGSVLALGTFSGDLDFDPGAAVAMRHAVGQTPYVVKLDSAGRFEWQRQLDSHESTDDAYTGRMLVDATGAIVISGTFDSSTIDFDPGPGLRLREAQGSATYLVKLTSGGDFAWVGVLEGDGCYVSALAAGAGGAVWAVGDIADICDLDPGEGRDRRATSGVNHPGAFVLKLGGTDGRSLGAWVLATGEFVSAYALADAPDGGVFVGGVFAGAVDFDAGSGTALREAHVNAGFVLRLAEDGAFRWVQKLTAAGVVGAASLPAGGVVVLASPDTPPPAGGGTTAFVTAWDANRSPLWTIPLGPPASHARRLAVGPMGLSVVGGDREMAVDVNPGPGVETLAPPFTFVSRFAF